MTTTAIPARRAGGFASHAVTYGIGNVARQIVGFLILPIYTRYLTPADYGAVGLLTFALALLEPFFGARLAQAVPKFYFDAKDERAKRAVIWSALVVTGSVSAVTTVLIVLLRYPASGLLFGTTKYALATALFAVNMVSQPIEFTGMMYIRLQERSRLYLAISMLKLIGQIILNILLVVYWRLSVVGVVLSGVITSLALGGVLTAYIAWHHRPSLDWATTRTMLRFSWPLWFAGLAGLYIGSSGRLYLRMFASLQDVGLLDLGTKFATFVGVVIWSPFFQHWEPVSFRYHSEGTSQGRFQVAFTAIATLMLVAGLGISIFSEPVINLMSTEAFHAAARTVPILMIGFTLNCLVAFFYFSFFVTQNTKVFSYCHYITAGVITVAYLALIPKFGLMGAVIGQSLAWTVNFTYVYFWSRRYCDTGLKVAPIYLLIGIGAAAYILATELASGSLAVNLAAKCLIYVVAGSLMASVGILAIRKASAATYEAMRASAQRLWASVTG